MYQEYWKLDKLPFENVNDSSFFYYSSKHKEALARLTYAIQQRKMGALLTGEYGTGKTFLSKMLKKVLGEDKYIFVFITNPRLQPLELVKEINYQLGGSDNLNKDSSKMDYLHALQNNFDKYHNKGVYPVVVVDEAQSIESDDLLEELRLLLNIQTDKGNYFSLILLGQPQLEGKVERIPQFRQRIAIRFRLPPLTKDGTKEYVEKRLEIAGVKKQIFTDSAYEEIYSLSGGMPRAINNMCDLSLLHAFIKKAEFVSKEIVAAAGKDSGESAKDTDQKLPENND